jgi:transposase
MNDQKFKPCNRDQMFLLPPSLEEWLPENHLAFFIIDVVEKLDLAAIYASYRGDASVAGGQ